MMLHENIRKIRREKGLTQEQLAELMGVSTASVSKWETGQSAPELMVLLELADYFGVSLDCLMGHQVAADRMEEKIAWMEAQTEEGSCDEAADTARMLLRNYPNEVRVLDRCANSYYRIYMCTGQRQYMEEAIALIQRLMALDTDPTGAKRLGYLSCLANQYELLCDWKQAERYYKEGNVNGVNDRALARCMANMGRDQEAIELLSEIHSTDMYKVLSDADLMAELWGRLGEPLKQEAVLKWGCAALETMDAEVEDSFCVLAVLMYVQLACLTEEQGRTEEADSYVHLAVRADCEKKVGNGTVRFISPGKTRVLVSNAPTAGGELTMQMLSKLDAQRLLAVAKEAME